MNNKFNSRIIAQETDFSAWYDSVIEHAQLALKTNVKGCIMFLPNAWALWEQIQKFLNEEFAKINVRNVAFPALLSLSDLEKEKNHVEGFAPELFLVNKAKQNLNLCLRPTSEIMFCNYFKSFVKSHNQLPILLNQWCNVFRVEKNTKAFLRTSEFHWQELHSLHVNEQDAEQTLSEVYAIYKKLFKDLLNIAVLEGEKTINERFAGANKTLTVESLMPDGQALQSGTAHNLGTNFSQAFDIKFQNKENQKTFPWQVSAGISTRALGAVIMTHGDNKGLVLPFNLAANQIVVLNLLNEQETIEHKQFFENINGALKSYRFKYDNSSKSYGFKIQEQELLGTPFCIIVGKKELEQNQVLLFNRLTGNKTLVMIDQLENTLKQEVENYSQSLYEKSLNHLNNSIVKCSTLEQVKEAIANKKIALAPWFDDAENETNLKKANLGFGSRCIQKNILDSENLVCFFSNKPANKWVYFARAY